MNRKFKLRVVMMRITSFLFGLLPLVLAAQTTVVSVPDIQLTPLPHSLRLAASDANVQIHDPRFVELGNQIIVAFNQFESNRSNLASSSSTPRQSAAGKASTTSTKLKKTGGKFFTLRSNGVSKAITVLQSAKFEAKFDKSGTVRALTALPGQVLQESVGGPGIESHTKTIQTFLRAQQSILGLIDPEAELRLRSSQADQLGHFHYRYQQNYKGIPVWGAELVAQLNDQGDLLTLNGAYSSTPKKLVTQPSLSKDQAVFSANTKFQSSKKISEPELVIFLNDHRVPHLAWRFEVDVSAIENRLLFLDAHDGTELLSLNRVQTGQASGEGVDLFGQTQVFSSSLWEEGGIYYLIDASKQMFDPIASAPTLEGVGSGLIITGDAENSTDPNATVFIVSSNTGPSGPWLPDGVSAAVNLSATYDYFLQRHNRNSLDGSGGDMIGIVRVGQNLPNAFFDGSTQTMLFGDADDYAGALDVVAHEMSHGVINNSAGLQYFGQSGALNESFADIFGEMAEQHFDQAGPDWLIGTRLSSPSRNLMNPGALEFYPGRPYPSKMSEFIWPNDPVLNNFYENDYNGVHINSSIVNHAFYLLTSGANGISLQEAERIFYRSLTTKLSALSEFVDMRFAAIQSANELFGENSPQTQQTVAAFDAVEIFDSPTNPPPSPYTGVAGPDGTLFVYWDGVVGAYYLGRLDPSLGDTAPGIQLSANPISPASPSAYGDGSLAVFVDAQQDFCIIPIDAPSTEVCAGIPGQIASIAMAPDGNNVGVVFLDAQGNPANVIGVINVESGEQQLFSLVSPLFDGVSSIEVIQADAMDFTSDNRLIVYDAFNAINFSDGSSVGLWSLYAIDLITESTITLIPPTQGFNIAYPNVAQTSDAHLTFDVFDLAINENVVVAVDFYTGDVMGIAATGPNYATPVYTGDDTGIVFSFGDPNAPTGFNLYHSPLAADRITPNGDISLWLEDADYATIYRRGVFTPPPEVDIGIAYATGAISGHVATFNLEVANNGLNQATNVAWTVSVPVNVNAVVSNNGGVANCNILADRIECQTAEINAGVSYSLEFQYTLMSLSSSGEVVSSVTAFADQPDKNSQDNTSIAAVSEASLNSTPSVVTPLVDETLTADVSAELLVSSNFDDSDGDQLTFSATGLPAGLGINTTSGTISGTPTADDVGNIFVVTVTAMDPFGAAMSDSFNISVNAAPSNQAPVANAGTDQSVNEGTIVSLAGTGTDGDGTIVSYNWQQESGTTVTITNASTANASFTAPLVSASVDLSFRLTVTDDDGATSADTVSVTVSNVPPPPPPKKKSGGGGAIDIHILMLLLLLAVGRALSAWNCRFLKASFRCKSPLSW